MTWKEIQPDEVDAGDYIDINGNLTELVEVDGLTGYADLDDEKHQIPVPLAALFGAKFKRKVEDPQHELIPTESGTVIRIGKCVYESYRSGWRQIGVEVFFSHETVQWCADRRGFEVLWPKQVETELVGEQ